LSPGHAIDLIVNNEAGNINIAAGGVNQMVSANGYGIAIAHDGDYLELRLGQLYPGSKGECPTMGGMKGIEIDIDRQTPGAPDTGDKDYLVFAVSDSVNDSDQGAHKDTDPAASTPDVRELLA